MNKKEADGIKKGLVVTHTTAEGLQFHRSSDIEKTLKKHNVKINEETRCGICGAPVTKKNFGMVIIEGEEKRVICDKNDCMTTPE